jgi:hypothetical protein
MKRVAKLGIPVLAIMSSVSTAQAGHGHRRAAVVASEATMATFAGDWLAHGAALTVTRTGLAKETISDGCCVRVIDVHYKLSKPRGSSSRATVNAGVTMVKVGAPEYFSDKSAPRIGQRTTFRRHGYKLTDNLLRATYCTHAAQMKSKCGA